MIRNGFSTFVLVVLALLFAPHAALAAQSYGNCSGYVTSLPSTISTAGTWCLKADLSTSISSGSAIFINSSNVILDCNDFKVGGLAAGVGTLTYGIVANNRVNVTVRHCNVRGFLYGVAMVGASGGNNTVEDNRLDNNTYRAVLVEGDGSLVQRNRIYNTGGTTTNADAYGISTYNSVDIMDNTVSGVAATSGGGGIVYGIYTSTNSAGVISGNGVSGLAADGAGTSKAIFDIGSYRITLRDNDLVGDASTGSIGLYCANSSGRAKTNVVSGFDNAILNCYDGGDNSNIP